MGCKGRRGKQPTAPPPPPDLPRAKRRKGRRSTAEAGAPRARRGLFRPRLLNGLFGDPVVYAHLAHQGKAVLFDIGDLGPLWSKALHKLIYVFVSHTHLDHFFDFDRLLRAEMTFLGQRTTPLVLVGSRGLAERVAARIDSYTWNLLDDPRPSLLVLELGARGGRRILRVPFDNGRIVRRADDAELPGQDLFSLRTATLDHGGISSLAFGLEERQGFTVRGEALRERKLLPGRWLDRLLDRVRAGGGGMLEVPGPRGTRRRRVDTLARDLLVPRPGQKLAYVTDAADTPGNRRRAIELCRGADWLFIETRYLEREADLALETGHLTIDAAADIADEAGAALVTPMHAAGRYIDQGSRDFLAELRARFPRLALYPDPVRPRAVG